MPITEGIASYNAAAALKPQAPSAAESGTDNRTVQQFQQVLQQQAGSPASTPVQPQTNNAVAQPVQSQQAATPRGATQTPGSSESDFGRLLESRPTEPQQQPSALNYGANGATTPARDLNQAGKVISLSV